MIRMPAASPEKAPACRSLSAIVVIQSGTGQRTASANWSSSQGVGNVPQYTRLMGAHGPPETIIALERGALDRWGKGDPQGYVDIYAPDITYFDPMLDKRVNGLTAMREYLKPIAGKVHVDSYEMIDPKVQQTGDIAVLTFNLLSHARTPAGQPIDVRWNSTEVYRRSQGEWRIAHSHWSFTRPALAQPVGP